MFLPLLAFSSALSSLLIIVFVLTSYSPYSNSEEKLTPFECGFDPLSGMRSPFSTRFFLLIVLFLIFDIEVALLFPILSMASTSSPFFIILALVLFLTILLFGMFHEWNEGALDWITS
uniref:NADH-ubiquinone oxidoreductase chain 3 n=1 Tax=Berthellina sp. TLT-2006 TaxID=407122 RepID=E6Y140_9GAST|nr:NADH dehydrogenase subunit 3 [Berthellina sp. TLT-2006]ABK92226.1 NADH dehydrogenase subunit 3 [Berthellina sp. TLT-2006]